MGHGVGSYSPSYLPSAFKDTLESTWKIVSEYYENDRDDDQFTREIVSMMRAREAFVHTKYGVFLTPKSGNRSLSEALEKILDFVAYTKNAELEETDEHRKAFLSDSFDLGLLLLDNMYILLSSVQES